MKDEKLRVEFRLSPTRTTPSSKPPAVAKTEHLRQDRAARRARNLALAYWIDGLVRSGAVPDLAAVARLCHVSRARVSQVARLLDVPAPEKARLLVSACLTRRPLP